MSYSKPKLDFNLIISGSNTNWSQQIYAALENINNFLCYVVNGGCIFIKKSGHGEAIRKL
jgi:hypothetical protein